MKNFKNNFKDKSQGFILWSVEFSKRLIIILSAAFLIFLIYSMVVPFFGITISDTLTQELSNVFKITVGAYLIKSVIENVFRYNKFSFSEPNGNYTDNNNYLDNNYSDGDSAEETTEGDVDNE